MSQASLGDEVEMVEESTDTAPIGQQPAQSAWSRHVLSENQDIGHPEVTQVK